MGYTIIRDGRAYDGNLRRYLGHWRDERGVVHASSPRNATREWRGTLCVASIQATWSPTPEATTCPWCLAMAAREG